MFDGLGAVLPHLAAVGQVVPLQCHSKIDDFGQDRFDGGALLHELLDVVARVAEVDRRRPRGLLQGRNSIENFFVTSHV